MSWFPSPGGDYGLSDVCEVSDDLCAAIGFRPLAGITVFRTWTFRPERAGLRRVSVPWRGLRSFGPVRLEKRPLGLGGVSVPWRGLRSFGPRSSTCRRCPMRLVSVPWRGLRSFGPRLRWSTPDPRSSFPSPGGGFDQSNDWLRFSVTSA